MAWSGVITNAGAAMLNQLAAGEHVLHIDSAKVGSGTTAAENMRSATALNTQKDSASILSSRVQSGRVQIKVQVGPNASAGYTAHEIGVWAHVDSGASALFALHQDTGDGVAIPSKVENPDFAFALYIVFVAANTASIAVTVDTSATITESTLAEALEDYATKVELVAAAMALSQPATASAKGMMSAADKEKLDGIAAQANKYVHPADKTASTGVPTANQTPGFGATFNVDQVANDNNGHVTGHTTRTVKIPDTAATQSAAGLMSAEDKGKLDNAIEKSTAAFNGYRNTSIVSEIEGNVTKVGKLAAGSFKVHLSTDFTGLSQKVFTLPNAYRPQYDFICLAYNQGKSSNMCITIFTDGSGMLSIYQTADKPQAYDVIVGNFAFFTA